ncbi:MAG: sorbosone dehydrogenase family protein [Planctomycetota bacterium]
MSPRPALALLLTIPAMFAALAACDTLTPSPSEGSPTATTVWRLEPAYDRLRFEQPIQCRPIPGQKRMAVAEKKGVIRGFQDEASAAETTILLDIHDQVLVEYQEMGLLGFVFSPTFSTDGHLYVNYTAGPPRSTRIARFTYDSQRGVFPVESQKILLGFSQPQVNHNGGCLQFGPDGHLYIGVGDGGGANDPQGNGQNLRTLLAKMLRIDVNGDPFGIPEDNPFADGKGGRAEIYAWGLRNPWRFSFDPKTGALWAADLGQNRQEEVDIIERGGNYGWNHMEGLLPHRGSTQEPLKAPVHVYDSSEGRSIIGGYVLRTEALPDLEGRYLFLDFYSGKMWSLPANPADTEKRPVLLLQDKNRHLASIDPDARGCPLFPDYTEGKIYRLTKGVATKPN